MPAQRETAKELDVKSLSEADRPVSEARRRQAAA